MKQNEQFDIDKRFHFDCEKICKIENKFFISMSLLLPFQITIIIKVREGKKVVTLANNGVAEDGTFLTKCYKTLLASMELNFTLHQDDKTEHARILSNAANKEKVYFLSENNASRVCKNWMTKRLVTSAFNNIGASPSNRQSARAFLKK